MNLFSAITRKNNMNKRYRFLRRAGWTRTHARTAILILFTPCYHGKFTK